MLHKFLLLIPFCFFSSPVVAQNSIELRKNQLKKIPDVQAELKTSENKVEPEIKNKKTEKIEKES